jgi:uncharacterized protein YqjF (DUF2071 family)
VNRPAPPRPLRAPLLRQDWRAVTFLHWRYEPEAVQRLLPRGIRVETRGGAAWITLVPFLMNVRGPVGPSLGWLRGIPETNVRTYVIGPDGRPGAWFFSLDITSPDVVALARTAWGLPYFWSRMSVTRSRRLVTYRCHRRGGAAASQLRIRIGSPIAPCELTELDHFLTARLGLWSRPLGVHAYTYASHGPWRLCHATVDVLDDQLVVAAGLPSPEADPLVHFSLGVSSVRLGIPRPVFSQGSVRERENYA